MATVHYTLKDWADRQGGCPVDTKPGLLFPSGAKIVGADDRRPPSPKPHVLLADRLRYRRLRIEDARQELRYVGAMIDAERDGRPSGYAKCGWDETLFGAKPATAQGAAARLSEVIAGDERAMADLEAGN